MRLLLGFAVSEHQVPETIDLVFDVFGVGDDGFLVLTEVVALFLRVFFVLAVVVGDLDKPDALLLLCQYCLMATPRLIQAHRPHKDVEMFGIRLHVRHSLDRGGPRTYDRDPIIFPLLLLIIFGPPRCMNHLALEFLDAFNFGPLEVVENPGGMQ